MRVLRIALLAAAAAVAHAQSVVDYTKLPACAKQCALIAQAEQGCVPPAAPVTDQTTYQSCFCLSSLLAPLHTSPEICSEFCKGDDATALTTYYNALCNTPVDTTQKAVAETTATTATTSSATGTSTADASKQFTATDPNTGRNWLDSHWRYVVMIVVLFVAFIAAWVGAIFLRRYFHRKSEAKRRNMAASDAPYNPRTPGEGTGRNGSTYNPNVFDTPPEMSAYETTALPTPPSATARSGLRSRSSTMTLGLGSTHHHHSQLKTPQPVVWGPHQHLASSMSRSANVTPDPSVPPSPTFAVRTPQRSFRDSDARRSEPRLNPYNRSYEPSNSNHAPQIPDSDREPPRIFLGEPIRDVNRHTLSAVKSDPGLGTLFPAEPQSAEILELSPGSGKFEMEPSPQKLTKERK